MRRIVDVSAAKVNQAGVIPVIFASSLLHLPQLILQLTAGSNDVGLEKFMMNDYLVIRPAGRTSCCTSR